MVRTAASPQHPLQPGRARGQTALKKLPLPQDPTARHVNRTPTSPDVPPRPKTGSTSRQNIQAGSKSVFHASEQPSGMNIQKRYLLLRKEVIQPHLPVRLPCYDFVLIAGPTFDGSLHKG
jgi:hypothetical protein